MLNRGLIFVVVCGLVACDNAQSLLPLPLVVTAQRVGRVTAQLYPEIDHSLTLVSMLTGPVSADVPTLNHAAAEVFSRVASIPESRISSAVHLAHEFVNTRPDEIQVVIDCLGQGTHCNATHMLTELAASLTATHMTEPMHAGRPVAGVYGVQYHATRCLFWLCAAIVHLKVPFGTYQPHPLELVRHWAVQRSSLKQQTQNKQVGAVDRSGQWRSIMSVFSSFDEFQRMYEDNSDFPDMIRDLCSNANPGVLAVRPKERLNILHACWGSKRETLFRKAPSNLPASALGLPVIPEYILALLAVLLLLMEAPSIGGCAIIHSNSDWQCTNGNNEGSICLLTCPNSGGLARGIDSSGLSLITCRSGMWFPQRPLSQLPSCVEVSAAVYDYGISRSTPLF